MKAPAIHGLTESLTDLSQTELRTVFARLRRVKLLSGDDPHNPGHLDTHPLVREYFGEQLRSQRTQAWKECSRRLFNYYRALAPELPGSFRDMEPLFLAVICGCNAGLYHEALNEVYIPRIQRGNAFFAANILGARGALLSALAHFFEHCRWGSPVEIGVDRHSLTSEDQLLILIQAALFLTATRESTPDIRICYQRAEALCHSLNRPRSLYVALKGQWRHSLVTDKLSTTLPIAKRVCSLAQEQNDSTLMMGAYTSLAATLYYLGDFQTAQQYAMRGLQIWRSGAASSRFEEVDSQPVACLCHQAIFEWHFGEIVSSRATMAESISLARELNDMHGLAVALYCSTVLAYFERNAAEVEHLSSDLIQLSARHTFAFFLTIGVLFRGWARSVSGNIMEGSALIEEAIEDYRAIGSTLLIPFFLALKAEVLHIAGRTSEALAAIREAEALVERFEGRWLSAELHRLRGVLLAAAGADEAQIDASFRAAIRIAKEQKSVSLERRAQETYAEYQRQKASASGGHGFRLPLW
jgi:tetratricopeptide (TPR) repeat protein